MRQILISLSVLLLLLGMSSSLVAQKESEKGRIMVRSEIQHNRVLLRWIASDAKTWELLNKYGVKLERQTIARDGKALAYPEIQILAPVLKPTESEELKELASQYPMGLVMAQAVFGEDFEVSLGNSPITKAIALDEQREQRYLFSSYAADLCYPVAKAIGWGWEDKTIKSGERYLYRVLPLSQDEIWKIQEGISFVVAGQKTQLIKPQALSAQFRDSSVLLSWDYNGLAHLYNSYVVERSEDGKNFKPITSEPITRIADGSKSPHAPITYIDSIPNRKTFYYRVIGLTPFGSKSPDSHTVSGEAYPSLKAIPMISSASFNERGGIQISWSFTSEEEGLLESFNILHSTNDKRYIPIKQGVASSERSYTIDKPQDKYIYYKIEAKPKRGASTQSLPVLLQPIDSIPPAIPTGLKAEIDSLGIVHLSWKRNRDADIYGYRLYRGETEDDELIPMTDIAIQDTLYRDSVNLQSLNSKVFYALTALDRRYNQSDLSEPISVWKPNTIPPPTPIITRVDIQEQQTKLTWNISEDPYLAGFIIYRKENGSNTLRQIARIEDKTERTYSYTVPESGKLYSYQIQAFSQGGLLSTISEAVVAKSAISKKPTTEGSLSLTPLPEGAIAIKWKAPESSLISVTLYKTNLEGKLYVYRENLPAEGELIDQDILQGKSNTYTIIVKHKGIRPQTIKKSLSL